MKGESPVSSQVEFLLSRQGDPARGVPRMESPADRGPLATGRPVEQGDRRVRNKHLLTCGEKMSCEGRVQGEVALVHDAPGAHCRARAVMMVMLVTVKRAFIFLVLVLGAGAILVEGNILPGSGVVIMVAGTLGGRCHLVVINDQIGCAVVAVTSHFVGTRQGVRQE